MFRDIKEDNLAMDGQEFYNVPHHPWEMHKSRDWNSPLLPKRRTDSPPRYYLFDFGLSEQYHDAVAPKVPSGLGGDQTVPEFRTDEFCDPFAVDVYRMGNFLRGFIQVCKCRAPSNIHLAFFYRGVAPLRARVRRILDSYVL